MRLGIIAVVAALLGAGIVAAEKAATWGTQIEDGQDWRRRELLFLKTAYDRVQADAKERSDGGGAASLENQRRTLLRRMAEIDQRDGRKDGKMGGAPVPCRKCGRITNTVQKYCVYCGDPVVADICKPFTLPQFASEAPLRVGFFPGSTVGNFEGHEAAAFLRHAAQVLGANAILIIGYDLVKAPEILNAAYNDAQGVTAEFNLNVLRVLNRDLGASFDLLTRTSDDMRRASFYIGLVVLGTIGPLAIASFALEVPPGSQFTVALSTAERKDMKPVSPSKVFVVLQQDDVFLFDQKFDVLEKPTTKKGARGRPL